MPALLRPDEAEEIIGVEVPEDEDYETLGGLMGDQLARMPAEGDSVTVRAVDQNVTLTVLAMDDLRVDVVRLTHEPVEDDEETES
jgi:CBS domain containing-hemolysin-like protein